MQRNFKTSLALAGLPLLITACGPLGLHAPQSAGRINAPVSWAAAGRGNDGEISEGWLSEFRDPELHRLVDRAMAHNHDLAAAAARMRQAEYQAIAGRSRLLPRADLGGSASLERAENGSLPRTDSDRYGLSVSASWEVDLWGRLRDLSSAEAADAEAARADFRNARLSLAAATTRSWCNLIEAGQQLELARVTLDSFERNLRISERIYKGTGEGALDVQFGRTNVASARRSLEAAKLARDEAARTLEVLTGSYPDASTLGAEELPELRRNVPAGMPAQLLERRPDLTRARLAVYASARRSDAARKALLPAVLLSASRGTPASAFAQLLDPDWLVSTISANLAQNLYAGGALTNEARAALEANRATVSSLAQLALVAFREVESALAADRSLAEQETFLRQEVEQAVLAENQATRDYADGVEGSDILDVLEAQRRANNAKAGLIRLRNQRLQNRIDLHLALGGDARTAEK